MAPYSHRKAVNLLVDTHVLIWFGKANRRLPKHVYAELVDPDNEIFVSVVSHWEIALKQQKNPDFQLDEPLDALLDRAAFKPIQLDFAVPHRLAELPDIHRDPFDRILVAQALHHDLALVSGDGLVQRYPVRTLW